MAGSSATLSISDAGLPADYITGTGSEWLCWNGEAWVHTHQLWGNRSGGTGRTDVVQPGVDTTSTPIGFGLPIEFGEQIPEVEPGIYRIDHIGFVHVEVIAHP